MKATSNLRLSGNSLIDIDYTYKLVKELENMKSAKNMEFKNRMFERSDTHKSSLFVGFNSASHSNLNNYVNNQTTNKTYANNMSKILGLFLYVVNQIFETSFSKKRKKWSKILTFFKRNTDMLVNLIPDEEPIQKSIFSISKSVLTRPKSHAKFRPYSVNKVIYLILMSNSATTKSCYTYFNPILRTQ